MITICLFYGLISLASLCGFLFISLGFHDLIFLFYDFIPLCVYMYSHVLPVLNFVINFVSAWVQFMWNLIHSSIFIMCQCLSLLMTVLSVCFPCFTRPLRSGFYFMKWTFREIWRGIFSRGNPFLTLVSWIIVLCTFLLCLIIVTFQRDVNVNNINRNRIRRVPNNNQNHHANPNDEENENQENGQVQIRQRFINLHNQHNQTDTEHESGDEHEIRQINHVPSPQQDENLDGRRLFGNQQLCIICIENVRNYAVLPCGHLHFCRVCVENLFRSKANVKCPVCNGQIREYHRIFV